MNPHVAKVKSAVSGAIAESLKRVGIEAGLQESIEIRLPKAVCLVLFELLAHSYEQWRKVNPDDASASPMVLEASHPAQRMATWQLEAHSSEPCRGFSPATIANCCWNQSHFSAKDAST
jgi:hypothetical protein